MRRRRSSPIWAHPLENEDLLEEILLRLNSQPSSLPRASVICKRWRSILSDARFLSRFRKHHQKPPLLGFFTGSVCAKPIFTSVLSYPNRIPATRFSVPQIYEHSSDQWCFMGCHHSLAILINNYMREVAVWDPLTGQQHRLPYPQGLGNTTRESFRVKHSAVLCADAEDGHVHGDCFLRPFKVILIYGGARIFACQYESASGIWENSASTVSTDTILCIRPSILVGNMVYWLFYAGDILAFDIKRQTLEMIDKPTIVDHTNCLSFQILQTNVDSGLHLAVVSKLSIQIWRRKPCSDGVVAWMLLQKNNLLEGIFPRGLDSYKKMAMIVGYDEVSNEIVLTTYIGDFMLQLESMQFRRISERRDCWGSYKIHYPYRNFYTAGRSVGWKWLNQKL